MVGYMRSGGQEGPFEGAEDKRKELRVYPAESSSHAGQGDTCKGPRGERPTHLNEAQCGWAGRGRKRGRRVTNLSGFAWDFPSLKTQSPVSLKSFRPGQCEHWSTFRQGFQQRLTSQGGKCRFILTSVGEQLEF